MIELQFDTIAEKNERRMSQMATGKSRSERERKKAEKKAKTQIFPKEGKTRFSQETAEKQGIP